MIHSDILESFLVTSNRFVRYAAQATGNSTPSAIWRALSILEIDGPHRVGELAAAARVTQPGMTRVLGTMVEEELVRRVADVEDSRAWLIVITQKGSDALHEFRRVLAEAVEPEFGELSDDDWQVLHRATELLNARLATRTAAVAS